MKQQRSSELFERAAKVIPGGVNSPVRAFRAVEGEPVMIARGAGAEIWDADGNKFIDLVASWGPLILGHAAGPVLAALGETMAKGTSFGACTEREVQFAELLVSLVPSLQKVRLVSSGTEATMSALRLARGFTGRDKVVKVVGGYHGHVDYMLVKAGSGAATFGVPDSAGVPTGSARDTLVVPYNDLAAVEALFGEQGDSIAALIIEPIAGNMGVIPPTEGYLEGLRSITRKHGTLLIFDEVITGFRVGLGGAQQLYGVTPDLTCLGKIIGGGLPVGAYGGRAEVMDQVAPTGSVYQAGTLSGNPLAVSAGLATLQTLQQDPPYERLDKLAGSLTAGLRAAAEKAGLPCCTNRVGGMFTAFFCQGPVRDFDSACTAETKRYARYHREMMNRGIYLAPSQFEAGFLSTAHNDSHVEQIVEAATASLTAVAG